MAGPTRLRAVHPAPARRGPRGAAGGCAARGRAGEDRQAARDRQAHRARAHRAARRAGHVHRARAACRDPRLRIVDDGVYLSLKPQSAKTIVTCLARFGGRPVGIVANQPRQLGGILDNDSADKAARFVSLCNAFGLPLVFLQDVPGFMVGTKVEAAGIIRHGAKMLHAVAAATVPKVTIVLRKAYGAGYYVMNGRAYESDLIVAWPTAEISVMGAEGAVEIVMRRQVEEADDPQAKRAELIAAYRQIIDVYVAARNGMIDDAIDPRETRPVTCCPLEMAEGKTVQRPWGRNAVVPV